MRMKYALLVLAPLALMSATGAEAAGGTASFSPVINWQYSPNLYFNVNGAPANVCGDVYVNRNGSGYSVTYGWICTDGSGNATKGPWTWAGQSGDEDAYAYVIWPDSTGTNVAHHIWDKTAPSITINSTGTTPPGSFSGGAYDGAYGSGFKSDFGSESGVGFPTGSQCFVQFKNTSTNLYWCAGSSSYSSSVACSVSCTISGMPSRTVTWSASQVPPGSAYVSTNSYEWKIIIYDNYNLGHRAEKTKTF